MKRIPRILLFEEEEFEFNPAYPLRNYDKQETCNHQNFKLFFKCGCTLTLGENNLDRLVEILQKEQVRRGRVIEKIL